MKAGDIIASSGCILIRMFTWSKWSHVAIATSNDMVLEAVKGSGTTSDEKDGVRETPFAEFLSANNQAIVMERPQSLSATQISQLKSFTQSVKSKKYTVVHAGLTMLRAFIWVLAIIMFLLSAIELFSINRKLGDNLDSYLISLVCVGSFLLFWVAVNIWSFRTNFGVATTEKLFCKTRFGRYLVNKKHDMFCSKLVLLADREIGGLLSPKVPSVDEVLPKHIVKACEAMDWKSRECK